MPNNKLTDNEIIKALEEYVKENEFEYFHSNTMGEYPLIRKALNLINRQKEEIEENTMLRATLKTAKVEAYKEFAELLQNICIKQQGCLYSSDIGAVYNELTGEQNDR